MGQSSNRRADGHSADQGLYGKRSFISVFTTGRHLSCPHSDEYRPHLHLRSSVKVYSLTPMLAILMIHILLTVTWNSFDL